MLLNQVHNKLISQKERKVQEHSYQLSQCPKQTEFMEANPAPSDNENGLNT